MVFGLAASAAPDDHENKKPSREASGVVSSRPFSTRRQKALAEWLPTRRTLFDGVAWGSTLCEAPRCYSPAGLLYDDLPGAGGFALCVDCGDLWLERSAAVAILLDAGLDPSAKLPALYEVEVTRPVVKKLRPAD